MSLPLPTEHKIIKQLNSAIDLVIVLLVGVATNLLAIWILADLLQNKVKIEIVALISIALIILSIIAIEICKISDTVAWGIALGLIGNFITDWFQQNIPNNVFIAIGILGLISLAATERYIHKKLPKIGNDIDKLLAKPSPLNPYPWYVKIIVNRGIARDIIAGLLSFSLFLIFMSFVSLDGLSSLLSILVMGAISALLSGRRSTACILPALISSLSLCITYEGISMSAIGIDAFFSIVSIVGALFFDALPKLW